MKYSIEVSGIHCNGCVNLIRMSFEEAGFTNVLVNQNTNQAHFETNKAIDEIKSILSTIFKKDLQNYKYTNLSLTN